MINTVTLNPALDKILAFDRLKLNNTNRLHLSHDSIGGKGTHISVDLSVMGIKSRAFGVLFGETGKKILSMLQRHDIETAFLYYDTGESRTNYVLIDEDRNCTLLCEKGPLLDEKIIIDLLSLIDSRINHGDIIAISGDASNIKGVNFNVELMSVAKKHGCRVVLDADGRFLKTGVQTSPYLIKPNVAELSELCGETLNNTEDIMKAVKKLEKFGIEYIVVTCGKSGSVVRNKGKFYLASAPDVETANTVGCGDAYLSGLLKGIEENWPVEKVLRCAAAAGAAKTMNLETAGFDREVMYSLMDRIIVEELKEI